MELQKVASIDLEEEAYLKPISSKGIGFYNLDKNTAQFQFKVTKNDKPLLISDENVKGYAFFKAQNGDDNQRPSISGVLNVDFIEPMNGIIGVTIPQWFLKNATNSSVVGEVYLSLNDAKNENKDDTVVLGTFTFDVRDSLVNQIESDIKVSYIRMFDDLRTTIESRLQQLQNDIGDTQNLMDAIKQIAKDALSKINKAQSDALIAIADNLNNSIKQIDLDRDESLRQIESKRDAVIGDLYTAGESVKDTLTQKQQEFSTGYSEVVQNIDNKVSEFNDKLDNDGFVTPTDVDNRLNNLTWQKSKLTSNDGVLEGYSGLDLNSPETVLGNKTTFGYATRTQNYPGIQSNGFFKYFVRTGNYAKLEYRPYNSNVVYERTKTNGTWLDWSTISRDVSDTGWLTFNLINGAISNTAFMDELSSGFVCSYRIIKEGSEKKVIIRLNGSNVMNGMSIAQLPADLTPHSQSWLIRVPLDKGVGIMTLRPSGDLKFYVQKEYRESWTIDDNSYFYGQHEFIV